MTNVTLAAALGPYRVTLRRKASDLDVNVFDCMAASEDHAEELAETAYPDCEIRNCIEFNDIDRSDWTRLLAPGCKVWWMDPGHGVSSGNYVIEDIQSSDGELEDFTIVHIKNDAGSYAEVFLRELTPVQPDNCYPLVDNVENGREIAGYATSKEAALEACRANIGNPTWGIELANHVTLGDGTTVPKAWLIHWAKPAAQSDTATIRLTVDVTYSLNGEDAAEMASLLKRMCERAIGSGMLTSDTMAEVEEHSISASVTPELLTEDELADYMLERIENGGLDLGDIPVRLARYGLMDPIAFSEEMRERMEAEKDE